MSLFLIKIGFLPISLWDVLDVLIVGYLFYQIYLLLRGSIAFNIVLGVLLFFSAGWLMKFLEMDLSSLIISQIANIGVITLIIIFQPEIRRFLLYLGQTTLHGRFDFINKFLNPTGTPSEENNAYIEEITHAIFRMKTRRWGALIVLGNKNNVDELAKSGQIINANISEELLLSIFNKESPLHDGAVLIHQNKIYATSCVLPISKNNSLPQNYGLRHRSGIGLTEVTNMSVIIVSEETGNVTFANSGKYRDINSPEELKELIRDVY
ncbi:MAG TPA: TIGR00159 family protein [Saprospiraceae bacterium]|nr:TIGR00159 family protein [Saprospiraceae bacterium]